MLSNGLGSRQATSEQTQKSITYRLYVGPISVLLTGPFAPFFCFYQRISALYRLYVIPRHSCRSGALEFIIKFVSMNIMTIMQVKSGPDSWRAKYTARTVFTLETTKTHIISTSSLYRSRSAPISKKHIGP